MAYNENLPADSTLVRDLPKEIREKGQSLKQLIDLQKAMTEALQFGTRPFVSAEHKIYYLDQQNGDDSNDGLSETTAFKTWGKVYSKIPIFMHHMYAVRIIGNYDGQIYVYNAHAHQAGFTIEGYEQDASKHEINGNVALDIRNATRLTVRNLKLKSKNTYNVAHVISSSNITLANLAINHEQDTQNGDFPLLWVGDSTLKIQDSNFEANEHSLSAMGSYEGALVFSSNNVGVARYGLRAIRGGMIAKSGTQPTGTVANENKNI